MDDIYVYYISIPGKVNEMVLPCFSGYTVYIDKDLTHEGQMKAYLHALKHIKNRDFEKTCSVDLIELHAHKED